MLKCFKKFEKKIRSLKIIKFNPILIIVFFIISCFFYVKTVSAATYYVRADGVAVDKTSAAGPVSNAVATMNLTVFNASSFLPGDTVYFSALGGDYTSQLTVPSSGDVNQDIVYEGISDGIGATNPMIDVSANASKAKGVLISGKNYITIKNFQIKGSGGAPAFLVNTSSGTAGTGYTIKVKNIDVLSAYGLSDATNGHNCFAHGDSVNENSQAEYWNITAAGCRPNSSGAGGFAFVLLEYAKARIHTAAFSSSGYGYTGTKSTQAEFYDTIMSDMRIGAIIQGGNMTATGSILCDSCTFTFNNGIQTFGCKI